MSCSRALCSHHLLLCVVIGSFDWLRRLLWLVNLIVLVFWLKYCNLNPMSATESSHCLWICPLLKAHAFLAKKSETREYTRYYMWLLNFSFVFPFFFQRIPTGFMCSQEMYQTPGQIPTCFCVCMVNSVTPGSENWKNLRPTWTNLNEKMWGLYYLFLQCFTLWTNSVLN